MGWSQLSEMKKAAQEAAEEQKELVLCPECGYKLEKNQAGVKHCKYCGWTDSLTK
jgi:ribosomal protein L37AE/L43A